MKEILNKIIVIDNRNVVFKRKIFKSIKEIFGIDIYNNQITVLEKSEIDIKRRFYPQDFSFFLINNIKKNVIKILKNKIFFKKKCLVFDKNIKAIRFYKEKILILLEIPYNIIEKDNLYAISYNGEILWRVETLDNFLSMGENICYDSILDIYEEIIVSDMNGRRFHIDFETGKILEQLSSVK